MYWVISSCTAVDTLIKEVIQPIRNFLGSLQRREKLVQVWHQTPVFWWYNWSNDQQSLKMWLFLPPTSHFPWLFLGQTRFCSEDIQKLAVFWPQKEIICDIWSASSKPHPNSTTSPSPPPPSPVSLNRQVPPSAALYWPSNACVGITGTRGSRSCLKQFCHG